MFERIMRSLELVKASWRILMEDKKLLAFPIMSGFFTLLVIATFVVPLIISQMVRTRLPPTASPGSFFCSCSTWSVTLS